MVAIVKEADMRAAIARVNPAAKMRLRFDPDEGGGLCLTADNDDDLRIATQLPAAIATDAPSPFVLPTRAVKAFTNAVRGETVEISVTEKAVRLVAGSASVSFNGDRRIEAFANLFQVAQPTPVRPVEVAEWKADAGAIAGLRHALSAVCYDPCRPVLTQVHCDPSGYMVATDSYRLAAAKRTDVPDEALGIPGAAIRAIPQGTTEMIVAWEASEVAGDGSRRYGRWLELACDSGTTITTRPVDDEFPNWQGLVPTSGAYKFTVDRDVALRELGRCGQMYRALGYNGAQIVLRIVPGDSIPWYMGAMDGELEMEGTLPVTGDGPTGELRIAFNPKYLIEAIRSCPTPSVEFTAVDNLKPIIVSDAERTHIHLVMPVRTA